MLVCYALAFALLAVSWAVILVDTGMLLQPVQRWVRGWHQRRWVAFIKGQSKWSYPEEEQQVKDAYFSSVWLLDDQWWWKPLWGCYRCVAGQFGFWGYLLLSWRSEWRYGFCEHFVFTCLTLFFACILTKIYQWTQS